MKIKMRFPVVKSVATLLALFILAGTFLLVADAAAGSLEFKLKDLKNHSRSYSELKGNKLTVIDFWATWCKPCGRSIPKLVQLNDKYKEKGVAFIGISIDGPRNLSKVRPYARSKKIDFTVLLDVNGDVMGRMNVKVVPTLIIVDGDDEVVYFHQGYRSGDHKVIEEEIVKLLSGSEE
ncbi:MAG: TlpA family protein disulfide reductase [Bacteroidales bacterium]|nr:TlpA family protein disulfide reductase [Candidatus Latescibacterota bacterium]